MKIYRQSIHGKVWPTAHRRDAAAREDILLDEAGLELILRVLLQYGARRCALQSARSGLTQCYRLQVSYLGGGGGSMPAIWHGLTMMVLSKTPYPVGTTRLTCASGASGASNREGAGASVRV